MIDVSVGVVIRKEKVLVHKRENTKTWALPGGLVQEGETPEKAVLREVFEETGYKVKITKQVAVIKRRIPKFNADLHIFLCKRVGGSGKTDHFETVEVGWLPLKKALADKSIAILLAPALEEGKRVVRTYTLSFYLKNFGPAYLVRGPRRRLRNIIVNFHNSRFGSP